MSFNDLIRAELEAIAIGRQQAENEAKEAAHQESQYFLATIKDELTPLLTGIGGAWDIEGDRKRAITWISLAGDRRLAIALTRAKREALYALSIEPQWSGGDKQAEPYCHPVAIDAQNLPPKQAIALVIANWLDENSLKLPD